MSIPEKMKAVDVHQSSDHPSAKDMHIATIPMPSLGASQALVRIRAFGLNRMDLMQRQNVYPLPPQAPKTMGVEFAGEIVKLHEEGDGGKRSGNEEGFQVGGEVFGLAYGGAYAEYIAVSTHMLLHKPAHLSFVQAAGIPETWITALQALYFVGEFASGKRVLWHAGASAVSIAGIQLSRAGGATQVFATARSEDKREFCVKTLRCDGAWDSEDKEWASKVTDAVNEKGAGVDLVIDFIGAPVFQGNLDVLGRDGRIVSLAALGGTKLPAGVDIGSLWRKRVRVEGSSLRSRDLEYQGRLRDLLEEKAMGRFESGEFTVHVEKELSWEKIVEAHELMESNKTKGKIICTIDW